MRKSTAVLILLLGISVYFNFQFWMMQTPSTQAEQAVFVEENQHTNSVSVTKTSPNNATEQKENRQQLLTRIQKMLASSQYRLAQTALNNYLRAHPQDVDFLLLEAEVVANTVHVSEVLAHYYQLLDADLTPEQQQTTLDKISQLTQYSVNQLKDIQAWDILATFLEPLWQFAPTSETIIVELAEAYARQQQQILMENVLASLMPDDPDLVRIRRLIKPNSASTVSQSDENASNQQHDSLAVPLNQVGNHFVVNANLNNSQVSLLIDTGASTTVISARRYAQIQKRGNKGRFIGEYMVNTAGGQVKAPVYKFAQLSIGNVSVQDIGVLVMQLEDFNQADGLLGMNFLREFTFSIDQQNAQLHLN